MEPHKNWSKVPTSRPSYCRDAQVLKKCTVKRERERAELRVERERTLGFPHRRGPSTYPFVELRALGFWIPNIVKIKKNICDEHVTITTYIGFIKNK